jgi:hypothetical protein
MAALIAPLPKPINASANAAAGQDGVAARNNRPPAATPVAATNDQRNPQR